MNRALVLSVLATSSTAFAGVEVGGVAGVHTFADDNALGVNVSESSDSLKNSAMFGGRIGVYFGSVIGVEVEGGVIPTEPRKITADVTSVTARGHVIAQFRAAEGNNGIIPFVLAGGGAIQIVSKTKTLTSFHDDRDGFVYVGAGLKYRAPNDWGIRADLRGLLVPSSTPKSEDSMDGGMTFDLEILLSVYKEFGRPGKKAVEPVKETPKDEDPDKDGVVGDADKCPTEAEDKDDFEDDNGCPDNDNDADGIADASDKCPKEAEDKDNFEDDDGCPELDNDKDGVPDSADKCVAEPETKNGFEDDDGCPDTLPEKVAKFTGAIQGITFKTGSTELAATSFKVLDEAVKVLVEFKNLKLEIGGHTDDVAPGKGSKIKDNMELSQGRADSVKAYFVKKGVEEGRLVAKGYGDSKPAVDPTGLKGKALNDARAKNRRVEFTLITEDAAGTPPTTPTTPPATPTETTPAPAPDKK